MHCLACSVGSTPECLTVEYDNAVLETEIFCQYLNINNSCNK